MSYTNNQEGSSHIVLVFAVLVLGLIGFAGYRVMNKQNTKTTSASQTVTATTSEVPAKITNKVQAQQASSSLDAESIDTTLDAAQLDAELNSVL